MSSFKVLSVSPKTNPHAVIYIFCVYTALTARCEAQTWSMSSLKKIALPACFLTILLGSTVSVFKVPYASGGWGLMSLPSVRFVQCIVCTVRLYFCTQYSLFFCLMLHRRTHVVLLKQALPANGYWKSHNGSSKKRFSCLMVFFCVLFVLNDLWPHLFTACYTTGTYDNNSDVSNHQFVTCIQN